MHIVGEKHQNQTKLCTRCLTSRVKKRTYYSSVQKGYVYALNFPASTPTYREPSRGYVAAGIKAKHEETRAHSAGFFMAASA